jgi:hypothetical protein
MRKDNLYRYPIVFMVLFGLLIGWLLMVQPSRAAGGVFTVEVVPQQTTYLSGQTVSYDINYACSGSGAADTCDNIFVTVPQPAGLSNNGTIEGAAQTVNHQFVGTGGVWEFIPSIPAGSTGQLSISWLIPNYQTPDGAVIPATAEAREGSATGTIVNTHIENITVEAEADWLIGKTVQGLNGVNVGSNPLRIGTQYRYVIDLMYDQSAPSLGRLNLENAVVVDMLPANATYVSSSNAGVYDQNTHTVTWPAYNTFLNSPANQRSVVVRYDAPPNQANDQVINQADFTGNGLGSAIVETGTTTLTNTLADPLPPIDPDDELSVVLSKLGGSATAGENFSSINGWGITMTHSNVTPGNVVTGTLTDILPCADNTSLTLYASAATPGGQCVTPATHTTSVTLGFQGTFNPSDQQSQGVRIFEVRWWTNTGTVGSFVPPAFAIGEYTLADLGIPAGEDLMAIEVDYEVAGVNLVQATNFIFRVGLVGLSDASLDEGDIVRNIASVIATDGELTGTRTNSGTVTIPVPEQRAAVVTLIDDANGAGIVYRPTEIITWRARYGVSNGFACVGIAGCTAAPVQPDWYIAVPIGLRYIPESLQFISTSTAGLPEVVESYPGQNNLTGYTIVHLRWPTSTAMMGQINNTIEIRFQTMVEASVGDGVYSGIPPSDAQAPTVASRAIFTAGYAVGIPDIWQTSTGQTPTLLGTDIRDIDEDGIVGDVRVAEGNSQWRVGLSAAAFGDVLIKGEDEAAFEYFAEGTAGGGAEYRINLVNASNDGSILTDFVFYTSLPHPGDTYISQNFNGQPRDSDTSVYLTGPVVAPANVNVFYSLSDNPCRDEVMPDAANPGCDNDWVGASGITDWSLVKGLKFTMSDEYGEGEGELVTIPVVIDQAAQPGDVAWLSIAYRAFNVTSNITLLPAEAPKVGITVTGAFVPPEDDPTCDPLTETCDTPPPVDDPDAPDSGVGSLAPLGTIAALIIVLSSLITLVLRRRSSR